MPNPIKLGGREPDILQAVTDYFRDIGGQRKSRVLIAGVEILQTAINEEITENDQPQSVILNPNAQAVATDFLKAALKRGDCFKQGGIEDEARKLLDRLRNSAPATHDKDDNSPLPPFHIPYQAPSRSEPLREFVQFLAPEALEKVPSGRKTVHLLQAFLQQAHMLDAVESFDEALRFFQFAVIERDKPHNVEDLISEVNYSRLSPQLQQALAKADEAGAHVKRSRISAVEGRDQDALDLLVRAIKSLNESVGILRQGDTEAIRRPGIAEIAYRLETDNGPRWARSFKIYSFLHQRMNELSAPLGRDNVPVNRPNMLAALASGIGFLNVHILSGILGIHSLSNRALGRAREKLDRALAFNKTMADPGIADLIPAISNFRVLYQMPVPSPERKEREELFRRTLTDFAHKSPGSLGAEIMLTMALLGLERILAPGETEQAQQTEIEMLLRRIKNGARTAAHQFQSVSKKPIKSPEKLSSINLAYSTIQLVEHEEQLITQKAHVAAADRHLAHLAELPSNKAETEASQLLDQARTFRSASTSLILASRAALAQRQSHQAQILASFALQLFRHVGSLLNRAGMADRKGSLKEKIQQENDAWQEASKKVAHAAENMKLNARTGQPTELSGFFALRLPPLREILQEDPVIGHTQELVGIDSRRSSPFANRLMVEGLTETIQTAADFETAARILEETGFHFLINRLRLVAVGLGFVTAHMADKKGLIQVGADILMMARDLADRECRRLETLSDKNLLTRFRAMVLEYSIQSRNIEIPENIPAETRMRTSPPVPGTKQEAVKASREALAFWELEDEKQRMIHILFNETVQPHVTHRIPSTGMTMARFRIGPNLWSIAFPTTQNPELSITSYPLVEMESSSDETPFETHVAHMIRRINGALASSNAFDSSLRIVFTRGKEKIFCRRESANDIFAFYEPEVDLGMDQLSSSGSFNDNVETSTDEVPSTESKPDLLETGPTDGKKKGTTNAGTLTVTAGLDPFNTSRRLSCFTVFAGRSSAAPLMWTSFQAGTSGQTSRRMIMRPLSQREWERLSPRERRTYLTSNIHRRRSSWLDSMKPSLLRTHSPYFSGSFAQMARLVR